MSTIMLLLIILISCHCSFVSGSSTIPDIREILVGERAELRCNLNSEATQLIWEHVQVGTVSSRTVVSRTEVLSGYSERFSINPDSNYTLVISKTLPQDAGLFMCRENTGRNSVEYELIVLESSPECSIVGEQTDAVSGNSCGLPVDDLTLVCRVRYSGDVPPELLWKDGNDVVHSRTDVLDNIARNIMTIKTKWDRRMYSCETNRSRSRCYVPAPRPLYILNSLSHMVANYPQNVTCVSNTSLSCKYRWTRGSELVSTNEKLEITTDSPDGEYHCLAECQLKGIICQDQPVNITVSLVSNKPDVRFIITATTLSVVLLMVVIWILLIPYETTSSCLERIQTTIRCRRRTEEHDNNPDEEQQILLNSVDWKSENLSSPTTIVQTPGHIKGITVLLDRIFIVRKSASDIEEYATDAEKKLKPIPVSEMREPYDLVSCKINNRLYVSDSTRRAIHIITLPHLSPDIWEVRKKPGGLSVTNKASLLVMFPTEREIIEYNRDRNKVRTLKLSEKIIHPRHAIQLRGKTDMFLVCNGEKNKAHQNLVFATRNGKSIVKLYDGRITFEKNSMWPTRLAETQSGDIIVVANQKVLLLDRNLKLIKSELVTVEKDHYPSRLFLDEANKRLYITENDEKGRILIYDIPSSRNQTVTSKHSSRRSSHQSL